MQCKESGKDLKKCLGGIGVIRARNQRISMQILQSIGQSQRTPRAVVGHSNGRTTLICTQSLPYSNKLSTILCTTLHTRAIQYTLLWRTMLMVVLITMRDVQKLVVLVLQLAAMG